MVDTPEPHPMPQSTPISAISPSASEVKLIRATLEVEQHRLVTAKLCDPLSHYVHLATLSRLVVGVLQTFTIGQALASPNKVEAALRAAGGLPAQHVMLRTLWS